MTLRWAAFQCSGVKERERDRDGVRYRKFPRPLIVRPDLETGTDFFDHPKPRSRSFCFSSFLSTSRLSRRRSPLIKNLWDTSGISLGSIFVIETSGLSISWSDSSSPSSADSALKILNIKQTSDFEKSDKESNSLLISFLRFLLRLFFLLFLSSLWRVAWVTLWTAPQSWFLLFLFFLSWNGNFSWENTSFTIFCCSTFNLFHQLPTRLHHRFLQRTRVSVNR